MKRQPKDPSTLMTSKEEFSDRSQDSICPPGRDSSVLISSTGHPAAETAASASPRSHTYEVAVAVRKAETKMNEMMTEGR